MGPVVRLVWLELSGAIGSGRKSYPKLAARRNGCPRSGKKICGRMRFFAVFCGLQRRSGTTTKFSTKCETRFSEGPAFAPLWRGKGGDTWGKTSVPSSQGRWILGFLNSHPSHRPSQTVPAVPKAVESWRVDLPLLKLWRTGG